MPENGTHATIAEIAAAKKMRFKPALRNGQPMDSTAVVHVLFQMAY